MTKSKLVIGGLILSGIISAGLYKRYSEEEKPINFSLDACVEKIMSAETLEFREIPFKWGNTYNILANGERVGTISEKVFSWGAQFDFYAGTKENGRYLGHAKEEIFSIGHKSTVYDENGKVVGKLDEKVLSLNPGTLIEVFDANGDKVAISDQKAISMHSRRYIYDASGKEQLGESFKDILWDNYTISVPTKTMDRRVMMTLTSMENKLDDERSSKDNSSE